MKKGTIFILMTAILFMACNSNEKENDKNYTDNKNDTNKTIELLKIIKQRTVNAIRTKGIKKVLLTSTATWYEYPSTKYIFKSSGEFVENDHGDKAIKHWKVVDNKLYINPKYPNKFLHIHFKAVKPYTYTEEYLNTYKYSLLLKSEKKVKLNNGKKIPLININIILYKEDKN